MVSSMQRKCSPYQCLAILATLVMGLSACLVVTDNYTDHAQEIDLQPLKQRLPDLDWHQALSPSPAQQDYFEYYGLDIASAKHHFGQVMLEGHALAVHVYRVERSRGSVVLVHGYYDHAGIVAKAIKGLLVEGYNVLVYDLPGHGLSDGTAATVDDFNEYSRVLRAVVTQTQMRLPEPYYIVAHSLSAGIVIDALLQGPIPGVDRVVLLAPLIRPAHWRLVRLSLFLFGPWTDGFSRVFRDNSSDPAFLAFMRADPLQAHEVPTQWLRALRTWERHMQNRGVSDVPIVVLQGEQDAVVDWHYNLAYIAEHFPQAKIVRIAEAKHQLFNETTVLRDQVLCHIEAALAASSDDGCQPVSAAPAVSGSDP